MKKLSLLVAFALMTLVPFAQKGKDYVTMKSDGKVYWIRGGETIRMMIDVPLKNGAVVNNKGNIKASNGNIVTLSKGDKVMMDGTFVKGKKKK